MDLWYSFTELLNSLWTPCITWRSVLWNSEMCKITEPHIHVYYYSEEIGAPVASLISKDRGGYLEASQHMPDIKHLLLLLFSLSLSLSLSVLSHPGIPGVTLMFLYRFVRRRRSRRHRPQTLSTRWLFEQLFGFLSFFWHSCWPWPIDYLIRFWSIFLVTLTLNFQGQIWNLLNLSQKWSDCHETKSKHISIGLWASNVIIGFDLGHDLDLDFSRPNMGFIIS